MCSLARGGLQVDLVGHSAGGWLARAFIGNAKYFDGAHHDPITYHCRLRDAMRFCKAYD